MLTVKLKLCENTNEYVTYYFGNYDLQDGLFKMNKKACTFELLKPFSLDNNNRSYHGAKGMLYVRVKEGNLEFPPNLTLETG